MALQPFVGPWPLLQFRNHFYTDGRTPWMSDQPVTRPLPTHRSTQTQNTGIHRHPMCGIRTHDPSVWACEDSLCLWPRGLCNRQIKLILKEIMKGSKAGRLVLTGINSRWNIKNSTMNDFVMEQTIFYTFVRKVSSYRLPLIFWYSRVYVLLTAREPDTGT
jgi:hypothetical protein